MLTFAFSFLWCYSVCSVFFSYTSKGLPVDQLGVCFDAERIIRLMICLDKGKSVWAGSFVWGWGTIKSYCVVAFICFMLESMSKEGREHYYYCANGEKSFFRKGKMHFDFGLLPNKLFSLYFSFPLPPFSPFLCLSWCPLYVSFPVTRYTMLFL